MAVTTTDFRNWLAVADPETPEEVYDLFTAVKDEKPGHLYDIKCAEGKTFVSADSVEETLMIVPHAKDLFLNILREHAGIDEDEDIETWYAFNRAIARDE
jgi:hypothetical protein